METLTKTTFEPKLIFTDEEKIEQSIKSAEGIAEQLNDKLSAAEEFLGHKLTDDDILDLLKKGAGSFMRLLRKQFQFPNASDEFNLEALGKEKDFESVKSKLSSIVQLFGAYGYELQNGSVKLAENGREVIHKEYKFYTENLRQNEVYELALELCEKLNFAYDQNYIDTSNMYQIEKGIDLISLPLYKPGKKAFIPNHKAILSYREDGARKSIYS